MDIILLRVTLAFPILNLSIPPRQVVKIPVHDLIFLGNGIHHFRKFNPCIDVLALVKQILSRSQNNNNFRINLPK